MRKVILFLAIISFILSLIFLRHHFSVFYFQNDINKIAVNIEMPKNKEIYVCFNKNCDLMNFKNDIYSYKLNQENKLFYKGIVNEIEFLSDKKTLYDIKKIDLFLANDYKEIKPNTKNIIKTDFLDKYSLKIDLNNNKTIIQKLGVYFEGIFYNWYFYLISYILILIYLIKYQKRFDFKIKHPIFLILFLALFLRLSHIDFIPLWNDELYVLTYISDLGKNFNLQNIFQDPGNPPLFFILSNIWLYFFHKSIFAIRFLTVILGVFEVYLAYFVLKKVLDKKIALIASFLNAINIFIILESNEIRCYILAMILTIFGFWRFLELKNNYSNKNLFLYLISLILLFNTHYYCILYGLANFILGLFIFKKKSLKFILCNFLAFLSFIPYLFITILKKSFDPNFNTWLEKPSLDVINNHIIFYFGNIIFFILTVIFTIFIIKKLKDKQKEIFIYNVSTISIVFIFAYSISIFIKPILFERYFCIFLPLLIINSAIILNIDFKTKYQPLIFLTILLFSINMPKYENFNLFSNIDLMAKYSSFDYKNHNLESYFIIPDRKDYVKYYPKIPSNKVIVSNFGIREDIDLIEFYLSQTNNRKNLILYLSEICINSKIKYSDKLDIKKIDTTIVPIYKIVIK